MRARKLHNANQRRSGRKLRGGKKIHQNSWPPPVDSGAFSRKRNDRFFQLHFSASSAARIAAPGIPGIEWTSSRPFLVYSPRETKFYPSSPSWCTHASGDAISLDARLFSLSQHGEKRSGRDAFIHVSSLLPHRSSRRAVTETVSASRFSLVYLARPRTSECSCPRLRVKQISFCINSRVGRPDISQNFRSMNVPRALRPPYAKSAVIRCNLFWHNLFRLYVYSTVGIIFSAGHS